MNETQVDREIEKLSAIMLDRKLNKMEQQELLRLMNLRRKRLFRMRPHRFTRARRYAM